MKKSILMGFISSLFVMSANAGQFGIEVKYDNIGLDGDIQYEGSRIDTKSTLGLDEKEKVITPRISYTTDNNSTFYAEYKNMKFKGNKTLTENFVFGDEAFATGSNVKSNIDIDWGTIGWYKTNYFADNKFNFKYGSDIHILKIKTDLENEIKKVNYDLTFGFPTLAFGMEYKPINVLSVYGDISGLPLFSYGHYLEYEVGMKGYLSENAILKAGYKDRSFKIDVEDNENFNLGFSGYFVGLEFKF